MIAEPLNDFDCLRLVSERAEAATRTEDIKHIAERFPTTRKLATWIRRLPQRNDEGDARDGPKVICDVPQRVRIPAGDPNCVERAAMYLAIAEQIDPGPVRQLATMNTPGGRHTFAVEDDFPMHLDPLVTRNALEAGMYLMHPPEQRPRLTAKESLSWALGLAFEPLTKRPHFRNMWRNACTTAQRLDRGESVEEQDISDLGRVLAVAEREAMLFGEMGLDLIHHVLRHCESLFSESCGAIKNTTHRDQYPSLGLSNTHHKVVSVSESSPCECEHNAASAIELRNASWKFPTLTTLAGHAEHGMRIALPWTKMAIKFKLASLGVPPEMVDAFEKHMLKGAKAPTASKKASSGKMFERSQDGSHPSLKAASSTQQHFGMLISLVPAKGGRSG